MGRMSEAKDPSSLVSATSQTAASSEKAGRRAWIGLLIVLGPVLLVSMDGSVLFLAMPTITHALARDCRTNR